MYEYPAAGQQPDNTNQIVVGGEPSSSQKGSGGWFDRLWQRIRTFALQKPKLFALAIFGAILLIGGVTFALINILQQSTPEQGQRTTRESNGRSGGDSGRDVDDETGQDDTDGDGQPDDAGSPGTGRNGGGSPSGGDSGNGSNNGGGTGGGGNGNGGGSNGGGVEPCAGYPTAACTGWQHTGVTLSAYTGPSTVTVDGTVIDGKSIDTCLTIDADNVTIKRSRIRCGSYWVVRMYGTGGLIEDTEIDAQGFVDANCLLGDNYIARRINCHNTGDGIRLGDNITIEDSIIHGLVAESGSHSDGMQATGAVNVVIRHNYIENPYTQTSCIILGNEFGPLNNILVENNLFNGGGYSVYGGGSDSNVSNIRFINNRFMRSPAGFHANGGFHGPVAYYDASRPGNQWSGNVWHDNGETITP